VSSPADSRGPTPPVALTVPSGPTGRSGTQDELRRVIKRIESRRLPRPASEPVEQVVDGQVVETGEGPLVVVRREYSLSHRHGRRPLADAAEASPAVLGLMARADESPAHAAGLLFLDTETTSLAGGTGTYAFLIGVGYVEGDRFVVVQHFMRDFDEEPALLAALEPHLGRATGLVTFNGSGFDVPLLETRFLLQRRRWPGTLGHVDLLRPARRMWAARLQDCRLATLEREVLGLVREDNVPGALIPSLYFDFLRFRRAAPLARVFSHNRADVLSLAALLGWFTRAVGEHEGALDAAELAGLGRLWERVDRERGAACYRAALTAGLEGPEAHRVRLRLGLWEKRRARWSEACALWRAAVDGDGFDRRPWEELAKYHEHRRRDFAAALALVQEALGLAAAAAVSPQVVQALLHRCARLERRIGAGRPGVKVEALE
jgi:uncharacterized protein YprB with RNaseH-like and TPR domain